MNRTNQKKEAKFPILTSQHWIDALNPANAKPNTLVQQIRRRRTELEERRHRTRMGEEGRTVVSRTEPVDGVSEGPPRTI